METGHAGAEVHHCWVYAEHREDRINARSGSPLRALWLIGMTLRLRFSQGFDAGNKFILTDYACITGTTTIGVTNMITIRKTFFIRFFDGGGISAGRGRVF